MMVVARRVAVDADAVRYDFGFEDRFDRVLLIDPRTLEARVDDGNFDSAASRHRRELVSSWRSEGEFPTRLIFAS